MVILLYNIIITKTILLINLLFPYIIKQNKILKVHLIPQTLNYFHIRIKSII